MKTPKLLFFFHVMSLLFFRVLNDNEVREVGRNAIGFGNDLPPEGLIM